MRRGRVVVLELVRSRGLRHVCQAAGAVEISRRKLQSADPNSTPTWTSIGHESIRTAWTEQYGMECCYANALFSVTTWTRTHSMDGRSELDGIAISSALRPIFLCRGPTHLE